MNRTQLPACRRYLSGNQKPNMLYTLAILNHQLEPSAESAKAFHALMVSDGIIEQGSPLPEQMNAVSCFQVVSDHKCGYICHICPYAKKNKNLHEMQEAVILSFALKNYENFQLLKRSGLQAEHLSALFLLNDFPTGKIVPTIPLTRLAYQYLAHKTSHITVFSELPCQITEALDHNNKERLLPQNLQTIRTYLSRLQAGYKSVPAEKVLEFSALLQSTRKDSDKKPECLTGLLKDIPVEPKPISRAVPDLQPSKYEDNRYLPLIFSDKEVSKTGFSLFRLSEDHPDYHLLETFLQFNPMIGAEIVTDKETNKTMLLLCASSQFYYLETDNEDIISLLASYFAKSRTRKQICMEPYRLYHYLSATRISYENVFSLQGAYKLLTEERGNTYKGITPGKMIKELLSRDNQHDYTPYLFVMPHYIRMFEVLNGHPLLQTKEAKYRLRRQASIDALMGLSYEYRLRSGERKTMFELNNDRIPAFSYQDGQTLDNGFYCVTFTFSSEKPLGSLVSNILYRIASKHLAETHGYKLLKFSMSSFTVSTAPEEYEHLCDLVANLATYLSEKEQLIPLLINENCYK